MRTIDLKERPFINFLSHFHNNNSQLLFWNSETISFHHVVLKYKFYISGTVRLWKRLGIFS